MPCDSTNIWTQKIFFTVFYRNPKNIASSPEFENFLTDFEILQKAIEGEKPYASFFTGDAHTQAWYPEGDTNAESVKLDEILLLQKQIFMVLVFKNL